MEEKKHAPFGSWQSPLSAATAAVSGVRFGGVSISGGSVVWSESLPEDDGRVAVMWSAVDGVGQATSPSEFAPSALISARSRVNEYGGGSFWCHGDPADGGRVYWTSAETQRIMSTTDAGPARPLTSAPPAVRAWRYAAGVTTADGAWTICERELHMDAEGSVLAEPVNDLVAVRTDTGDVVCLVGPESSGFGDFTSSPRLSDDGRFLAWLRWDHPDMPWDAAELWSGEIHFNSEDSDDKGPADPQVRSARRVAGGVDGGSNSGLGRAVSVCLPEWSPDGRLWWCDDSNDFWHLYMATDVGLPGEGEGDRRNPCLPDRLEEVGEPRWVSGGSRYGFTIDGQVVFAASAEGVDSVWVFNISTGAVSPMPGPEFTYVEMLVVSGNTVALVGGMANRPSSIWHMDLDRSMATDLRSPQCPVGSGSISKPEPMSFEGVDRDGIKSRCHAIFYPPTNAQFEGESGELPPLLIRIHGGPTASARVEFSTSVQFWTTRGFAVADVNYRGSTGYGRKFRDLLRGAWGVADVEDCLAVAGHLGDLDLVDPTRCVIRGGSAGGFTALAALCFQHRWGFGRTFSAACSLYGVTDLAALASDTHKFESRYLDGLVGEYPARADLYEQRSPLFHAELIEEPVLLLQGSEDRIVPPSQAEVLVAAMTERGVPHAYVLFDGEGHGFIRPDTVTEALETELSFYGETLGFRPAGELPGVTLVQ